MEIEEDLVNLPCNLRICLSDGVFEFYIDFLNKKLVGNEWGQRSQSKRNGFEIEEEDENSNVKHL